MRYCDLCNGLLVIGYCPICDVPMMTNKEMDDPEVIRDVRSYLRALPVSSWSMGRYLANGYLVSLREAYHPLTLKRVHLDLNDFEENGYREWFRDLERPVAPETEPYIQEGTRDRFRTMATVLRMIDPVGTAQWGLRPANDAAVGDDTPDGDTPRFPRSAP